LNGDLSGYKKNTITGQPLACFVFKLAHLMIYMNKKEVENVRWFNYKKYCTQGNENTRVKKNVITPHGNSYEHEKAKFDICWMLKNKGHDFITEAYNAKTKMRHDIVDLDTGYIYEVETDPKRAERFNQENIIVVKLFENKALSYYIET